MRSYGSRIPVKKLYNLLDQKKKNSIQTKGLFIHEGCLSLQVPVKKIKATKDYLSSLLLLKDEVESMNSQKSSINLKQIRNENFTQNEIPNTSRRSKRQNDAIDEKGMYFRILPHQGSSSIQKYVDKKLAKNKLVDNLKALKPIPLLQKQKIHKNNLNLDEGEESKSNQISENIKNKSSVSSFKERIILKNYACKIPDTMLKPIEDINNDFEIEWIKNEKASKLLRRKKKKMKRKLHRQQSNVGNMIEIYTKNIENENKFIIPKIGAVSNLSKDNHHKLSYSPTINMKSKSKG